MKISDVALAARQFLKVLETNSLNCRVVVTIHEDQWERFDHRAHLYLVPPDQQWPARKIPTAFMLGGIEFRQRRPNDDSGFTKLAPRFPLAPPSPYRRRKLRTVVLKKEGE